MTDANPTPGDMLYVRWSERIPPQLAAAACADDRGKKSVALTAGAKLSVCVGAPRVESAVVTQSQNVGVATHNLMGGGGGV